MNVGAVDPKFGEYPVIAKGSRWRRIHNEIVVEVVYASSDSVEFIRDDGVIAGSMDLMPFLNSHNPVGEEDA